MSFSYTPTNISQNGKDRIRFELGDTDAADPLLQDEEIAGALSISSNGHAEATARAARAIAVKFTRQADLQVGPLKLTYQNRAAAYTTIAESFEGKAGLTPGDTSGGAGGAGISAGGMAGAGGNYFGAGMMDNPVSRRGYPDEEGRYR